MKKYRSSELKSIVCGMLLGDAGLTLAGKRSINYRLYFAHSLKQKNYALWKQKLLESISTVTTSVYFYKHPVKNYESIRITTNARRFFSKFAAKFYTNKTKVVTLDILNALDSLGLAIWYMDDGSLQRRGNSIRATLHTQSFSLEENKLIQKWFFTKYNISTRIQVEKKSQTEYYRQEFNSEECEKLLQIISPHVNSVECMKYKI